MSRKAEGLDFLEHYGVKGMKWGVRRTRESLAKAASERKASRDPSTPEGAERARRQKASAERRLLDDGDLDRYINRLEKEKKLKSLVEDDLSPGKKAAKAILSDTGKRTLGALAAYGAYKAAGKIDPSEVQQALQDFFKKKK